MKQKKYLVIFALLFITLNLSLVLGETGDIVEVNTYALSDGTSSNWLSGASCDAKDGNEWVVTCTQTWGWGRIEGMIFFETKEKLENITIDVDFIDWAGQQDIEGWILYDDDTTSKVFPIKENTNTYNCDSTKTVKGIKIQEGQFGWFQMKVDLLIGTEV